ncbi:MAG: DUF4124 domain-containing protein [Gammaproteobacteria bacterium]|nr:DUF4124 domain-containing protein [Gammaproteobacteria bacterium]
MKPAPALVLAIALCTFATQLSAATLYKWVDEDGKVRYSDRLPANQSRKQHQQLNSQGMVLSTRDAAKTPEQLADEAETQRKLDEVQNEEARLKAIQHQQDQVLLMTFSSGEEIEHARDSRIQVIDSVIGLIESSVTTTQEKLDQLKGSADRNYVSKSKEIPGGLAQKIEHFERKIEIRHAQLVAKVEEKEKIRQKYKLDLERFQLLNSASN